MLPQRGADMKGIPVRKQTIGLSFALMGVQGFATARSQFAPQTDLDAKVTTVRERDRPQLTPAGYQVGAFVMYPSIGLAAEFDSNVRAIELDGEAGVDLPRFLGPALV